jgi:hypothetical protein
VATVISTAVITALAAVTATAKITAMATARCLRISCKAKDFAHLLIKTKQNFIKIKGCSYKILQNVIEEPDKISVTFVHFSRHRQNLTKFIQYLKNFPGQYNTILHKSFIL